VSGLPVYKCSVETESWVDVIDKLNYSDSIESTVCMTAYHSVSVIYRLDRLNDTYSTRQTWKLQYKYYACIRIVNVKAIVIVIRVMNIEQLSDDFNHLLTLGAICVFCFILNFI